MRLPSCSAATSRCALMASAIARLKACRWRAASFLASSPGLGFLGDAGVVAVPNNAVRHAAHQWAILAEGLEGLASFVDRLGNHRSSAAVATAG